MATKRTLDDPGEAAAVALPAEPTAGPFAGQAGASAPPAVSTQEPIVVPETRRRPTDDEKLPPPNYKSASEEDRAKAIADPPLAFTLEATCGRARASTVRLPHGDVLTPVFMPVGTQGTIKGLTSEDMASLGCRILLGNTFHLANRPTCELLDQVGGLHKFMHWPGNILTDSGGFQMVSLLKLAEIKEEGVEFEDPKNAGSRMLLTPEKSIQSQNSIGADIIMALDDVVSSTIVDKERIVEATIRTNRWVDRCIEAHQFPHRQNLFGIVQGHLDPELREYSLAEMITRNFPGYAIGGLSGGEAKESFWRVVEQCTRPATGLPANKPRYLMGVGYPLDIVVCVALGVDMFDCVYPSRTARFGTALVRTGQLRLTAGEYANDHGPLEEGYDGPLKDYSRAMLHTIVTKETVASSMLTLHNLWFMLNLLSEMRGQIKANTFHAWVRKFVQDFFPVATPPPCQHCPPRWVRPALDAAGINIDDLFDWSDAARELPDMPKDGGKARPQEKVKGDLPGGGTKQASAQKAKGPSQTSPPAKQPRTDQS